VLRIIWENVKIARRRRRVELFVFVFVFACVLFMVLLVLGFLLVFAHKCVAS